MSAAPREISEEALPAEVPGATVADRWRWRRPTPSSMAAMAAAASFCCAGVMCAGWFLPLPSLRQGNAPSAPPGGGRGAAALASHRARTRGSSWERSSASMSLLEVKTSKAAC